MNKRLIGSLVIVAIVMLSNCEQKKRAVVKANRESNKTEKRASIAKNINKLPKAQGFSAVSQKSIDPKLMTGGIVVAGQGGNHHKKVDVSKQAPQQAPQGQLQAFRLGVVKTKYGPLKFFLDKDFGDLEAVVEQTWKGGANIFFNIALYDANKKVLENQGRACSEKLPQKGESFIHFFEMGKGNVDQIKYFAITEGFCG